MAEDKAREIRTNFRNMHVRVGHHHRDAKLVRSRLQSLQSVVDTSIRTGYPPRNVGKDEHSPNSG